MPNFTPTQEDNAAPGNVLNTLVSALIQKANPADIQALLGDTALSGAVKSALGKAHELMEGEGFKQIEDQWDGPPDARAPLKRLRPGGSQAEGIPYNSQGESMRGGNAETMGGRYSDYAPQGSAQSAYEHFGRSLASVRKSVLSLVEVAEVQKAQQDATGAVLTGLNTQIADIVKSVTSLAETVGKLAVPVVKADDEKKEEKKDDKDDKNPFGKSGAEALWGLAKSRVDAAVTEINKALEAKVAGKDDESKEHGDKAKDEVDKARTFIEAAKAVDTTTNDLTTGVVAALAKAMDDVAPLVAVKSEATKDGNQDKWPASKEGAAKAVPDTAALTSAMDKISKALDGIGMLRTDMAGLMGAVGGQSRNPTGLPPAFELAKATPDMMAIKRSQLSKLRDDGEINQDQFDQGSDLLVRVEAAAAGRLDARIAQANIERAPAPIRNLFTQQAA